MAVLATFFGTKVCRQCGQLMDMRHDGPARRAEKRFCNRLCFGQYLAAARRAQIAVQPPRRFTVVPRAARVETWSDLPPMCPRCAGPWQSILGGGGVRCVTCGRDCFVQAAIEAVLAAT